MLRSALRAACTLFVLALSACDSSTSDPEGVAGTYTLRMVNGERPPVMVWSGTGGNIQVTDADVRLDEDGGAFVELTTRVGGTAQSTIYRGTYEQTGDVLELGFLESPEGQRVGAQGIVISGNEIGMTLTFAVSHFTGFFQYPVSIIARR